MRAGQARPGGTPTGGSAPNASRALLTAELELTTADGLPGRLRAALLLLAGRDRDAIALLDAPALESRDSVARAVLPYLLAAACSGPSRPTWAGTRVAALLRSVDDLWVSDWTAAAPRSSGGSDHPQPTLSSLLADRIVANPQPPARREVLLAAALREIQSWVDAVVGAKHRGRYRQVAGLVACAAEAMTIERNALAARTFVATWSGRYPRHVAFRRELDKAVVGMPCDPAR